MDDSKGLSYFFLGLGIGVAVGILFAPQSGEETRGLIKSKAQEGGDYLKSRAQESGEYLKRRSDELKGTASDLVDRGKSAVAKQREQLSAAIDAGKQAYREAVANPGEAPAGGPESI